MLSYNHIYHAGCAADVFKHTVLALILKHLNAKDKPYTVIDTHAGRGIYCLSDERAQKTGEAEQGIKRLLAYSAAHDIPSTLMPYMNAVKRIAACPLPLATHSPLLNTPYSTLIACYPGSPAIAFSLMREGSSLILCELHPTEVEELRLNMKVLAMAARKTGEKAVQTGVQRAAETAGNDAHPCCPALAIHFRDAFEAAVALTPPKTRGLLFMDPSYEDSWEYKKAKDTLKTVLHRWHQGIIALWYPILDKRNIERQEMLCAINSLLPQEKVLNAVFMAEHEGFAMKGSGMLVLNPPYQLSEEIKEAIEYITKGLGTNH